MLSAEDRHIATKFKHRLEKVTPILDLRVFGSRARGDSELDSDLDIFIEVEVCTPTLRSKINEIAWQVGFEMDRVISTFVVTREQITQGPLGASPLVLNIEREGVAV